MSFKSKLFQRIMQATRMARGRLVPSHRFDLDPGSLKGAMSNVVENDLKERRVKGRSGHKFRLTEIKHPVLMSVDMSHKIETHSNGPILGDDGEMVLRDQSDPNLRWVKQVYEILTPSDMTKPVFRARNVGTGINGDTLWAAELALPIRQNRLPATQRQVDTEFKNNPQLVYKNLPEMLREATLYLPYQSELGPQSMELHGRVNRHADEVTFAISGDAIALAFKLLKDSREASIELLSDYSGYEAMSIPATKPKQKTHDRHGVPCGRGVRSQI